MEVSVQSVRIVLTFILLMWTFGHHIRTDDDHIFINHLVDLTENTMCRVYLRKSYIQITG
jgi:hypothetical protein